VAGVPNLIEPLEYKIEQLVAYNELLDKFAYVKEVCCCCSCSSGVLLPLPLLRTHLASLSGTAPARKT